MGIDYNSASLQEAFLKAGINNGDTVFMHVSLGRLGRLEGAKSIEDMNLVLYQALTTTVGPTGNILIPTYSYSIGKKEVFDVQKTSSTIGPFTEFFRTHPLSMRSREPMLAVSGQGPGVKDLFTELPLTSFGDGSLYGRLRKEKAKICTLGVGLFWATFRHHIEEMAQVPFRFKKNFRGVICDNDISTEVEWTYFAAYLVPNCDPYGQRLEKRAREVGISKVVPVGRSEIITIDAQDYFEFGFDELKRDPWLTAKGPPENLDKMILFKDPPSR